MSDTITESIHNLVMRPRPYRLCFTLLGLPKILSNGAHGHWRVAAAEKQKWRTRTAGIALAFKPSKPLTSAKLTLIRRSSSECDFDNLVISFKSVIDGLRDAGIISNDKMNVIGQPTYLWERAAPTKGSIVILVEENEVPEPEKAIA